MTTVPTPNYDPNKARLRALSRGIGSKLFNQKVIERYEGDQDLLDTCLIQNFDTVPEIIYKQLTFFLTLENYTPIVEERIKMRNKPKKGEVEIDIPWMILHFKFKERYVKDRNTNELKKLGHRRIQCHNVDFNKVSSEAIKKVFDGTIFYYGDAWIGYNFRNNKEIRLRNCESREKAINLINKFNQFTLERHQQEGNTDDNLFDLSVPKNSSKPDHYGLTGYLFKVAFHVRDGSKTKQLRSIMIANKLEKKR